MIRRVELFQDKTFEPHYDEGLGCDVSSAREKKRVMKALGVIETGDWVHGARNFDRHAPTKVSKFAPQGIPFQRAGEGDQVIETVNRDGTVVSRAKFSELPKS